MFSIIDNNLHKPLKQLFFKKMLRTALFMSFVKLSCGLNPQKTTTATNGDPSCVMDWNGTLEQHFKFSNPDIQYNLTIIGSQKGVVT